MESRQQEHPEVLYFLQALNYFRKGESAMKTSTALRAALAFLIFVLGNLQAWDSNVHEAGLWIVLLVSLAIPLYPISLLLDSGPQYALAALVLALVLLLVARALSPLPLPELFLILLPAALGLIFSGLVRQEDSTMGAHR